LPRRRPRTGAGRGEGGEQRETGSGERERDKSVEALFLAVTAQSKRFKPSAVADPEEGEAGGGEERHGGGVAECRREDGDRGHRGKDTRPSKPPYHTLGYLGRALNGPDTAPSPSGNARRGRAAVR